jgi:membrane-bound metal-dependent hydrolase YbcI (DUF457 family)
MASFVGHSLAAVAAYKGMEKMFDNKPLAAPWDYLIPASLGILPDLDIIFYIVSGVQFGDIHRGISHSFVFCLFYALVFSLVYFLKNRQRVRFPFLYKYLIMLFASTATHPILDYFMARGPHLPLFWPLSHEKFISPIQLIPTAYYSLSMKRIMEIFVMFKSFKGYILELVQFLPLILIHSARTKLMTWFWLILSLGGFLLTFLLYSK